MLGRQGGDRWPRGPGAASEPPCLPQVCYAGRCQNLLVYGNKNCSAKCNNHGVCGVFRSGAGAAWHVRGPDAFLPRRRCATTSASVTVSRAGQRRTASTGFQGRQQVWQPRAWLVPAPSARERPWGGGWHPTVVPVGTAPSPWGVPSVGVPVPTPAGSPQGAAAWSGQLCWPCWGSLAFCWAVPWCSSGGGGRGTSRKGNSPLLCPAVGLSHSCTG